MINRPKFLKICTYITLILNFAFCSLICSADSDVGCPENSAKSAIVMTADTCQVLYEKNSHEKLPMASTTKIMTALLTVEEAEKCNREITITNEMVPVEGSSMGLQVGDVLTLESLARGMMAVSGNDAAHSAAVAISGSTECFAEMMNEKARSFGMCDTHFVTPSGLDVGDHHSTAYDMALLASHAMDNSMFYDIVSKSKIEVPFIEPKGTRILKNSNRLLREYDGAVGVKTGYTKLAKRCLVSSAERGGIRLVAVTLSDPNDWEDHKRLLDYGFSKSVLKTFGNSRKWCVEVVGGEKEELAVYPKESVQLAISKDCESRIKETVELPRFVYAPIKRDQVVGQLVYTCDGRTLAKVNLTACEVCDGQYIKKGFFQKIKDFFGSVF